MAVATSPNLPVCVIQLSINQSDFESQFILVTMRNIAVCAMATPPINTSGLYNFCHCYAYIELKS